MRQLILLGFMVLFASSVLAKGNLVDTKHNLAVSGPGPYKSKTETRLCVFCHTPHGGRETPLWNRRSGGFDNYKSSTLNAKKTKSAGSSELCLSCHDGTIALGEMLSRGKKFNSQQDEFANTRLKGRANISSDLSNDHPVAIYYDEALRSTDPDLIDPGLVDLPLDQNELQCTSCHDPHGNDVQPFLHKSTLNGELCVSCHQPSGSGWNWADSAHASSDAKSKGADPWPERKPEWKGKDVKENACMNCHAPHNAATPARLVNGRDEETCFRCHNGMVTRKNIVADQKKMFRHSVADSYSGNHDLASVEDPLTMQLHVECADCHNPHATRPDQPMISFDPANPFSRDQTTPPLLNAVLAGVPGIDNSGAFKPTAEFEYEVCFRCHGVPSKSACDQGRCQTATRYNMARQDGLYNLRDKLDPGNSGLRSYHPVIGNNPENNNEVPSLRDDIPLDQVSSLIYCSDCHNGDNSPAAGGTGAAGLHGSRHEGILALPYEIQPDSRTSGYSGSLCIKCHSAVSLYRDESFPHRKHVREGGKSCINCHDPHGSARFPHLINFLTNADVYGQPLEITGTGLYSEPTWQDDGRYAGTCYLNCHGVVHDGWSYPASPLTTSP